MLWGMAATADSPVTRTGALLLHPSGEHTHGRFQQQAAALGVLRRPGLPTSADKSFRNRPEGTSSLLSATYVHESLYPPWPNPMASPESFQMGARLVQWSPLSLTPTSSLA